MEDTCMILDVQGFTIEQNKFIPKELAAYDGQRICHYIFRPPFAFGCLSPDADKQSKWLMKHHHCIDWEAGYTPLYKFSNIVKSITQEASVIYVKGKEKATFLRKYSSRPILEFDEQPPLKKNAPKCFYHLNNNCVCSLFNVFYLYDQFVMQQQ